MVTALIRRMPRRQLFFREWESDEERGADLAVAGFHRVTANTEAFRALNERLRTLREIKTLSRLSPTEAKQLVQNFGEAASEIDRLRTYGKRTKHGKKGRFVLVWSNAFKRWDVGLRLPSTGDIKLDSNEVLLTAANRGLAETIARRLPDAPSYAASTKA